MFLSALFAVALGYGTWAYFNPGPSAGEIAFKAAGPVLDVAALGQAQLRGRKTFNAICAECHGQDAMGGDGGPPLIHKIYEPSHHADGSFYLAAARGVQAHHWGFGDMPPQPGVTQAQMTEIIGFVRAAQRQNGIM
ncbi:MAG: c-type cytochrome [Pikeienuella sp.]